MPLYYNEIHLCFKSAVIDIRLLEIRSLQFKWQATVERNVSTCMRDYVQSHFVHLNWLVLYNVFIVCMNYNL